LNDGSILAWGSAHFGGKIPDTFLSQMQPVKTIIPKGRQFTALCMDGSTFTWGFKQNIQNIHTNPTHLSIFQNKVKQFVKKNLFFFIVLMYFNLLGYLIHYANSKNF
jgi:hypothetical protein